MLSVCKCQLNLTRSGEKYVEMNRQDRRRSANNAHFIAPCCFKVFCARYSASVVVNLCWNLKIKAGLSIKFYLGKLTGFIKQLDSKEKNLFAESDATSVFKVVSYMVQTFVQTYKISLSAEELNF